MPVVNRFLTVLTSCTNPDLDRKFVRNPDWFVGVGRKRVVAGNDSPS